MIDILVWFTFYVGAATILIFVYGVVTEEILPRIKAWWKSTNKIQRLCKHEYKEKNKWYYDDYCFLLLECRLCGKTTSIKVYEDEKEE